MTPAPDPRPSGDAAAATNFETSLNELGDIVARLESGSLGLAESIDAYERGVGILRRLHDELAAAEERVNVLVRIDEDGRPILEPAAAGGGALPADSSQSPAAARQPRASRAKTPRARSLPGMDEDPGAA